MTVNLDDMMAGLDPAKRRKAVRDWSSPAPFETRTIASARKEA